MTIQRLLTWQEQPPDGWYKGRAGTFQARTICDKPKNKAGSIVLSAAMWQYICDLNKDNLTGLERMIDDAGARDPFMVKSSMANLVESLFGSFREPRPFERNKDKYDDCENKGNGGKKGKPSKNRIIAIPAQIVFGGNVVEVLERFGSWSRIAGMSCDSRYGYLLGNPPLASAVNHHTFPHLVHRIYCIDKAGRTTDTPNGIVYFPIIVPFHWTSSQSRNQNSLWIDNRYIDWTSA